MLHLGRIFAEILAITASHTVFAAVQSHSVSGGELTLTLATNEERITDSDITTIGKSVFTSATKILINLADTSGTNGSVKRLAWRFEDQANCPLATNGEIVFPNLVEIGGHLTFFPDEY